MVRDYELGLVINPDLSDEQIDAVIVRVGQTVEARGGAIVRMDRWGRRRMAYPIERHRDGYYTYLDLHMDSSAVREVERVVLVQEDIMRHLITMIDPRTQEERKRRQEQEAARQAAVQQRIAAEAAAREAHAAAQAAAQAATANAAEPAATATEEATGAPQIPAPDQEPETLATAQPVETE